jgi:phenylacetate-CoA ligase
MKAFLYRLWLQFEIWKLALLRRVFITDKNLYVFLNARQAQPVLAAIGRMRAHSVFLKAQKRCPAYRDFLKREGYAGGGKWSLADVPVMTKENYVKRYSIEERCYGG